MAGNSRTVTAIIQADDHVTATLRAIAKIANETAKQMETAAAGGLGKGAEEAEAKVSRLSLILKEAAASARQLAKDMAVLAGPAILGATKIAIVGGARIQHQAVQNAIAGIGPQEETKAAAQAASLAGQFPLVNTAEIIQLYRELRSVLKDSLEVPRMLPDVVKAKSVLDASDPSGQSSQGLLYALRAGELFGLGNDPKKLHDYLDSFLKATQVEGRTINPEQLFEFATSAKASAATLSPAYVNTIAPLLSQEMTGPRAGTATDAFVKQIVGGFQGQLHSAAKEFVALGLAKQTDFETTKTGEIKGLKSGHHVTGYSTASSDPNIWVWNTLIPSLKAKGFVTEEQQLNEVRRLFPNANAANLVAKLIQQKDTWEEKIDRISKGAGLGAFNEQREDPTAAIKAVTTAFDNLLATLASPGMRDAALALSNLAEGISSLSAKLAAWQKDHPKFAEAIADASMATGTAVGGALSYMALAKLFAAITGGGTGLSKSAVALGSSAALLDRAALALSAAAAKSAAAPAVAAAAGAEGAAAGAVVKGAEGAAVAAGAATGAEEGVFAGLSTRAAGLAARATGLAASVLTRTNAYVAAAITSYELVDLFAKDQARFAALAPDDKERERRLNMLSEQRDAMREDIVGRMQDGIDPTPIRTKLAEIDAQIAALKAAPAPYLDEVGHPKIGSLDQMAIDLSKSIRIDDVKGTVNGEATIYLNVDASGVTKTETTLRLDGTLGQSRTVPSGATGQFHRAH